MHYPDFQTVLTNSGIPPDEINALLTSFKPREYKKDAHLLRIGEPFDSVFLIHHGAIRNYYLNQQGQESNKLFFFDKDIVFPVAPIARNQPSLFGIVTAEPTALLQMPFAAFKAKLESMNVWQPFYLTYLEWLVDEKIQREHRLLTLNKAQIIEQIIATHPQVIRRISDYHIASYLGMSPVTYCRLKRNLNI